METRYTEVYKGGKLVNKEPYEVSDEQLEQEARQAKIKELLDKPIRTNAENARLIDLLAAHQGFSLPVSKNARTGWHNDREESSPKRCWRGWRHDKLKGCPGGLLPKERRG